MYYAFIENDKINGIGQCPCDGEGIRSVIISEEIYNNIRLYMWDGSEIVLNPNYEKEQEEKEKERISHLQCTKRVFILMLEQMGLDYFEQILPLIKANRQAELEWELCVELERANPLLDLMGAQLGVSPTQIDNLFKYANGEITQEQFLFFL